MDDDDDGRTPEHGHPVSSPSEPSAQLGELKKNKQTVNIYVNIRKYILIFVNVSP